MKTTNLEISKKLKEIGFEAECSYLWFEKDQAIVSHHGWIHPINEVERINKEAISYIPENSKNYPAYDLETLLDALPKKITTKFKHFDTGEIYEFEETLKIYKSGISYSHNEDDIDWYRTHYGYYSTFDLSVNNSEGLKSLADTAGKLLIQLFEEGIINFKK